MSLIPVFKDMPVKPVQNSKILSPTSKPPFISPRATRSGKKYSKS